MWFEFGYSLWILKNTSQFSLVLQSCLTLCDPMDCSTAGLPVHHCLLEFTHTHVHWVGDAIQPSHPLSSPSPAFYLSQHQGLFKWLNSSHQVAKVLELQFQQKSFQWNFRTDFIMIDCFNLHDVQTTLKSFLNTTVQKHQFISFQSSLRFNSHIHTWLMQKS